MNKLNQLNQCEFKIDTYTESAYNKECVICFEAITYCKDDTTTQNKCRSIKDLKKYFYNCFNETQQHALSLHPDQFLYIKKSHIILCCGHNFHSECFLLYIIHKLYRDDFNFLIKSDDIKCPICRASFKCSTIHKLFKEYKTLLSKDNAEVKHKINKLSKWLKYQKVVFSIRRVLRKEIYIGEIYNYYKIKRIVKYFKAVDKDIQKKNYILKLTKVIF